MSGIYTYALGGAPVTWRTDSAGAWRKEYKLFDHLGSVRSVLRKGLADNSYEYREQISYMPFGGVKDRQYCTDNATPDARLKYIGKQLDYEMNLADHGVRKYDNTLGQFTSIDPMWEKYYGWTPYQYCGNNPLMAVDADGKKFEFIGTEKEIKQNKEYYDKIRAKSPFFNGLWTCLEMIDLTITIAAGQCTNQENDKNGMPTGIFNDGQAHTKILENVETTPEEQLETGKNRKSVLVYSKIILDQKDIKTLKTNMSTPLHELGHVLHALFKPDEFLKASNAEKEKFANSFARSIIKTFIKLKR